MKILFVAPRFHNNLYYRVKALQDEGHEVSMSVFYTGETECHNTLKPNILGYAKSGELLKKISLVFFPKNKRNTFAQILSFFPAGTIRKEIGEKNIDVVILKGFLGLFALQTLFWARFFNKRIYLLLQTNKHHPETFKKKFQIFILKKVFRVSGIISPLKNELDKFDDFFKYIPFAIEISNFEKKYFKNDKINIITIGKFTKRKAQMDLVRAISNLKDKYNIHLTIVGEKVNGDILKKIERLIAKKEMRDMVTIKYNINNKNVFELYKDSDLYVLPSYNEPAAYSILEAMTAKLPLICSDTNGTKCYIKEGENGYIFESKNIKSLRKSIEEVIVDREHLQKLGERSFEIAKENYSTKLFANLMNKLILNDKID